MNSPHDFSLLDVITAGYANIEFEFAFRNLLYSVDKRLPLDAPSLTLYVYPRGQYTAPSQDVETSVAVLFDSSH